MAGGYPGNRSLEQTPTWAVAVVCFVLVLISILIEHSIHLVGRWLIRRQKRALYEALEKVKSELMLLGFISLLLTIGQAPISNICIPQSIGDSWHPCSKERRLEKQNDGYKRRLLWASEDVGKRRVLAGGGPSKCGQGTVPFVSSDGIHQLHIFIFVLAVFHVLHCVATMFLGRLKMKRWKSWENETKTVEYQFTHDPERFRLARDTSFGRRHLNVWSRSPILLWTVCFFRQFVTSVAKVDYLTLRHGFIVAHLSHQSSTKFDFHKYIKRSLEEDFKVVVGISPTIWFCAVLFLLFYTHGWYSYFWLPFLPLIVILMVGTKLQVIITKMGLKISERGDVVKGLPLVQPDDNLFWFNKPSLLLYLAHFVLFQNAFQLAIFVWAWYEFGLRSCFHEQLEDITIRLSMGLLIQFLCSYVILPLYALVSQMGSTMKPTIFNERVASALKKWLYTARKHIKDNRRSGSITPRSPRSPRSPSPSQGLSPVHLLRRYRSDVDGYHNSPNLYSLDKDKSEPTSPSNHPPADDLLSHRFGRNTSYEKEKEKEKETLQDGNTASQETPVQHEINVYPEFSFDKLQGEVKRF